MTHIGVELRIRAAGLPEGQDVLMQADSDRLHLIARINQQGDGWAELMRFADSPLIVEARPVELPDSYPDPDDNDDQGD